MMRLDQYLVPLRRFRTFGVFRLVLSALALAMLASCQPCYQGVFYSGGTRGSWRFYVHAGGQLHGTSLIKYVEHRPVRGRLFGSSGEPDNFTVNIQTPGGSGMFLLHRADNGVLEGDWTLLDSGYYVIGSARGTKCWKPPQHQ